MEEDLGEGEGWVTADAGRSAAGVSAAEAAGFEEIPSAAEAAGGGGKGPSGGAGGADTGQATVPESPAPSRKRGLLLSEISIFAGHVLNREPGFSCAGAAAQEELEDVGATGDAVGAEGGDDDDDVPDIADLDLEEAEEDEVCPCLGVLGWWGDVALPLPVDMAGQPEPCS